MVCNRVAGSLMAALVPALPLGFEQQSVLHILKPGDMVFWGSNEYNRLTGRAVALYQLTAGSVEWV